MNATIAFDEDLDDLRGDTGLFGAEVVLSRSSSPITSPSPDDCKFSPTAPRSPHDDAKYMKDHSGVPLLEAKQLPTITLEELEVEVNRCRLMQYKSDFLKQLHVAVKRRLSLGGLEHRNPGRRLEISERIYGYFEVPRKYWDTHSATGAASSTVEPHDLDFDDLEQSLSAMEQVPATVLLGAVVDLSQAKLDLAEARTWMRKSMDHEENLLDFFKRAEPYEQKRAKIVDDLTKAGESFHAIIASPSPQDIQKHIDSMTTCKKELENSDLAAREVEVAKKFYQENVVPFLALAARVRCCKACSKPLDGRIAIFECGDECCSSCSTASPTQCPVCKLDNAATRKALKD